MDIPYLPYGSLSTTLQAHWQHTTSVAETARILPHFEVLLQAKQGTEISLGFSS